MIMQRLTPELAEEFATLIASQIARDTFPLIVGEPAPLTLPNRTLTCAEWWNALHAQLDANAYELSACETLRIEPTIDDRAAAQERAYALVFEWVDECVRESRAPRVQSWSSAAVSRCSTCDAPLYGGLDDCGSVVELCPNCDLIDENGIAL